MPEREVHRLHRTHGDPPDAISDGVVALLKEYYGRGPTQAKTCYQDDLVVCLLRGGFTRVEQTLLDGGAAAPSSSSGWRFRRSCASASRPSSSTPPAGA